MNRHSSSPLPIVLQSSHGRFSCSWAHRSILSVFMVALSATFSQNTHAQILPGNQLDKPPLVNLKSASLRSDNLKSDKPNNLNQENKSDLWITVFVHGIMSVKPHLTINNFIRFMQDKIQNTFYEKTILLMRDDPFFYQNQAMGPRGLHLIDPTSTPAVINNSHANNNPSTRNIPNQATQQPSTSQEDNSQQNNSMDTGRGSVAMAYLFDQIQQYAQTGHYHNRYYTFGWTGLLSPRQRYEDGRELFKALDHEVQRLKKQGLNPKVRVIGYSHGGNVCLNIGAAHQKDFPDSSLIIDELVLIGTPIQHDTDYLINDPIFKKIYNLYSTSDRVQKLDFFSTDRFFSGRRFVHRPGFAIPEKLTQVQVKVMRNRVNKNKISKNKISKNKISKKRKPDAQNKYLLDFEARGIKTGKSPLLRNASPGHAELWFFGWTPQHYRSHYPLYPLPTIAMLPFITKNLDLLTAESRNAEPHHLTHHFIVDIRPEQNIILFKDHKKAILYKAVPFIEKTAFEDLKKTLFSFAPAYYTKEDYETHTKYAIDQAFIKYKHLYAPAGKKHRAHTCRIDRNKAQKKRKLHQK